MTVETQPSRRTVLQTAILAGAASPFLGLRKARAASPTTAGWIYVGPKNDFGYNQSHHDAVEMLRALPGLKVLEAENIPETDAVEQAMESMINYDGANILFLTSYGYFEHMINVSKKYPNVVFRHQELLTDLNKDPPNTGSYYGYISEALYGCGIAAALSSKTKKLGFIAAKPIPAVLRSVNSFTRGARSIDPSINVQLIFTGDWSVPNKEAEAANALADNGVDGIACHIDNLKVVLKVAGDRGMHSCGLNVDQSTLGTPGYLTGALYAWEVPYGSIIKDFMMGKPSPRILQGSFPEGFVKIGPFGADVPAPVRDAVTQATAALASKTTYVFNGPMMDNRGKQILASGKHFDVTDPVLADMDWLVEGVLGSAT